MKAIVLRFWIIAALTCSSMLALAQSEAPTWSDDVACLIYNNCSTCHNENGIAPFSLTSYEDAFEHRFQISEAVSNGSMPPWMPDPHFQRYEKELYLEEDQIDLIKSWVDEGAPSGNLDVAPEAPSFSAGPALANPDLEVRVPDYEVPDLPDVDLYRCFVFDHGLPRDRYIQKVEIIPSDPSLVHHVIIFQDSSGTSEDLDAGDPEPGYTCFGGIGTDAAQMIAGWAPGVGTVEMPEGFGVKVSKNARLVVQVHYPEGNAGKIDDTQINLQFAEENDEVREILILPLLNHFFGLTNGPLEIKAGERKTFHQQFLMPFDVTVTGIAPHAHLVCESMKAWAVTPAGDTIKFIDIPHWDFEWQGYYQFQKPIHLPPFSMVYGEGSYNNTSVNHHLPYDMPRDVSVGESTTDEMMIFFFGISGYEEGDEEMVIDTTSRYAAVHECQAQTVTSTKAFANIPWQISPNPSNGNFQVDVPDEDGKGLILKIYDPTGKLITQNIIASQRQEILIDAPAGIYYAHLGKEGERSRMKKLVVH